MRVEVLADADAVARRGALFIAAEARSAIAARGRFALAVSGGSTPWQMLRALADCDMQWNAVHLFQVDERVAPAFDPDRNLTHIEESLLARVQLPPGHLHAMAVEDSDLDAAARSYAQELATVAGARPILDLVHLGLGPDGHTASLVPGDTVLDIDDADVAATAAYLGHRRLTLTYPALDRARGILFVVTGAEKTAMLQRLCARDRTIPAGRVNPARARVMVDRAAAGPLALTG